MHKVRHRHTCREVKLIQLISYAQRWTEVKLTQTPSTVFPDVCSEDLWHTHSTACKEKITLVNIQLFLPVYCWGVGRGGGGGGEVIMGCKTQPACFWKSKYAMTNHVPVTWNIMMHKSCCLHIIWKYTWSSYIKDSSNLMTDVCILRLTISQSCSFFDTDLMHEAFVIRNIPFPYKIHGGPRMVHSGHIRSLYFKSNNYWN